MEILYLHPCAATSALWLGDKHSFKALAEAEKLLATACQMIACDLDDRLAAPDLNHPLLPWVLESIHHYQWLLSYYHSLIAKSKAVFSREYRAWKLELVYAEYLKLFPRIPFTTPPVLVPEDCVRATADESYRLYYCRCRIGVGVFRRVRLPYFVKDYFDAH